MMSDRKCDLCPRCGHEMKVVPGSDRTVPGGTWWIRRCPNCLHTADLFKPRRSKKR